MRNSIAVSLAILIVLLAFHATLFPDLTVAGIFPTVNVTFNNPAETPAVEDSVPAIRDAAWTVFQKYLTLAREHNLAGVAGISYQLSATCQNPSRLKDCYALMDGVYTFAKDFKEEYFKYTFFDKKQIVMETETDPTLIRVALLFVRKGNNIEMLGIKYCLPDETSTNLKEVCFNTDPATRDLNHNGWWDDLESQFHK